MPTKRVKRTKRPASQGCQTCASIVKVHRAKLAFNPWHVCCLCGNAYQGWDCAKCGQVRAVLDKSLSPGAVEALMTWVKQVADNAATNAASDAEDRMDYQLEEKLKTRK